MAEEPSKEPIKLEEIEARRKQVAELLAFGEYTDEMRKLEAQVETKKLSEIFSIDNQILTTYIPELKCNINYKQLSWKDFTELDEIKDDAERGNETIFRMIQLADDTVEREEFQKLTPTTLSYIILAINRKTPIFLQPKPPEESRKEIITGEP